jgi:hypothetical protein
LTKYILKILIFTVHNLNLVLINLFRYINIARIFYKSSQIYGMHTNSHSYLEIEGVCSSICSECFICFKRTLQVFCLDVVKVDLDVAYTCMLHAYFSSVFRCFHAYVYKCFIWMLHMFAIVFKCFSGVSASVSDAYFKCFIYLFFGMLQLLYLDISKVDRCCI